MSNPQAKAAVSARFPIDDWCVNGAHVVLYRTMAISLFKI